MKGLPTLPPSFAPGEFTDDVLSHLFLTTTFGGTRLHLLPNPSHLEAVAGVALGFARGIGATGGSSNDRKFSDQVLSVQIHGDGAFVGQGVSSEILNLSSLPVRLMRIWSILIVIFALSIGGITHHY